MDDDYSRGDLSGRGGLGLAPGAKVAPLPPCADSAKTGGGDVEADGVDWGLAAKGNERSVGWVVKE